MTALSVCVTVKNRSRVGVGQRHLELFPNCVRSLVASVPDDVSCELVVADWGSDDWPLNEWLADAAGSLPVRVSQLSGHFSRGRGLNAAAAAARGDVLFFTDADIIFCPAVLREGLRHVHAGQAFFPVVYAYADPGHTSGDWLHWGLGNCMLHRSTFEGAGRWPEYTKWGGEDDDLFARVQEISEVVREEVPGFLHQWHPDDILWKDRYALRTPGEIEEVVEARKAIRELANLVPRGRGLILVDEARFGVDVIDGRVAHAFLEMNGAYGGPPADDTAAIEELERLRASGADVIAFAWMAFWWLDHYTGFRTYLTDRFELIRDDDRLKVFDLRTAPST